MTSFALENKGADFSDCPGEGGPDSEKSVTELSSSGRTSLSAEMPESLFMTLSIWEVNIADLATGF